MNKAIKNLKKIVGSILIISLLLNLCNITMAENIVNTEGGEGAQSGTGWGEGYSAVIGWEPTVTAARVSLWDTETQTLIECKDMINPRYYGTFDDFCNYKLLSIYTKPEIIALGSSLTGDMINRLNTYEENDKTLRMGSNVCPEPIEFPELLMRSSGTAAERQKVIKDFYKQPEKTKELLRQLNITDEAAKKFEDGKACFLIEPLIGITTSLETPNNVPEHWFLTCAELGLLALNGWCDADCKFMIGGDLKDAGFKALPYGTFKENDGLIKAIKAYTGPKTNLYPITDTNGFREMVKTLGCLEINTLDVATPSDTTPVDILLVYHPNLEQISGHSQTILNDTSLNSYWRIGENTKTETEINITKTYNDSIAPEPPEGSDPYKYEWYNLKPDCTGKRFKVDDTGKIPNEALEYDENKKESEKRGKKTVILYWNF